MSSGVAGEKSNVVKNREVGEKEMETQGPLV